VPSPPPAPTTQGAPNTQSAPSIPSSPSSNYSTPGVPPPAPSTR
jgi:hypothetical protein